MAKSITLKCTANALVDGELVKAGAVAEYDEQLGKRLIASNRFEVTNEDPKGAAETPKTVAEYKAALDELEVDYDSDDRLADLKELYEEATA